MVTLAKLIDINLDVHPGSGAPTIGRSKTPKTSPHSLWMRSSIKGRSSRPIAPKKNSRKRPELRCRPMCHMPCAVTDSGWPRDRSLGQAERQAVPDLPSMTEAALERHGQPSLRTRMESPGPLEASAPLPHDAALGNHKSRALAAETSGVIPNRSMP